MAALYSHHLDSVSTQIPYLEPRSDGNKGVREDAMLSVPGVLTILEATVFKIVDQEDWLSNGGDQIISRVTLKVDGCWCHGRPRIAASPTVADGIPIDFVHKIVELIVGVVLEQDTFSRQSPQRREDGQMNWGISRPGGRQGPVLELV